jgi:hypothetical protein
MPPLHRMPPLDALGHGSRSRQFRIEQGSYPYDCSDTIGSVGHTDPSAAKTSTATESDHRHAKLFNRCYVSGWLIAAVMSWARALWRGVAGPTGLSAGRRHGRLYQQLGRLERENAALREQVDRLQRAKRLQTRVRKLTGQVEELRRAAKRHAAPFSKNTP